MRIAFGGPPQSGKSVLVYDLKKRLPIGSYMPVRAAPDGEGDWTQELYQLSPLLAARLKREGKFNGGIFNEEFVGRAAQLVKNCNSRLGLIDLGGIPSDENRRICKDADAMVIVSSDEAKIQEWLDFAQELGLRVLAILHSIRGEVPEQWTIEGSLFKGTVVGLDREKFRGSITIEALVQHLLNIVPEPQKETMINTLTIQQIAIMIGKREEGYVLPDGRRMPGFRWEPADLPLVVEKLKPLSALGTPWVIDGPGPQWLIACVLGALYPCPIILTDTKVAGGMVSIGQCKRPIPGGAGEIKYAPVEELKGFARVRYKSENFIDAALLPTLYPPAVMSGKAVLLNGLTATWGLVEIVSAYMCDAPAIYVGQAVDGYIYVCAVTHSPEHLLGSVIREKDVLELINNAD